MWCSCMGLVNVEKLPGMNAAASPLPVISQLMIRNHRRYLTLDAIEVDPDAEAGASQPAGISSLDF